MKKTIIMTLFLIGLGINVKSNAQSLDVFNDATCGFTFGYYWDNGSGVCSFVGGQTMILGPGATQRFTPTGASGSSWVWGVSVGASNVRDCTGTTCPTSCTGGPTWSVAMGAICGGGTLYTMDFTPASGGGTNASVWIH